MSREYKAKGFTLIESLVVMMIVGILAAYAVARYPNTLLFSQMSIYEGLKRDIYYAQTLALSLDTSYTITILSGSYSIAPAPPLGAVSVMVPSGVTLTAATIVFNSLGNPGSSSTSISVQATGLATKTITVAAETGYLS